MSFKKKKNVILLTLCMVTCFILYQIYIFSTISSETTNRISVVPVLDHNRVNGVVHVRSEADKFVNELGSLKGVLGKDMVKYRPDSNNKFKCLNSDQRIPFEFLNDDFCDCEDGTDEPSTNACSDGVFYCDMQYQRKPVTFLTVPSSRVNDGICDCCDGSDEWILEPNKKLLSQSFENHFRYRYLVALCPNVC